jgi:hypothetical protein
VNFERWRKAGGEEVDSYRDQIIPVNRNRREIGDREPMEFALLQVTVGKKSIPAGI